MWKNMIAVFKYLKGCHTEERWTGFLLPEKQDKIYALKLQGIKFKLDIFLIAWIVSEKNKLSYEEAEIFCWKYSRENWIAICCGCYNGVFVHEVVDDFWSAFQLYDSTI